MTLGEEETHKPVEQNRKPKHSPTQEQPTDFWQMCSINSMTEVFSTDAGVTGKPKAKSNKEPWLTLFVFYKS